MKKYYQSIFFLLCLIACFEANSQRQNRSVKGLNASRPIESYIASYSFDGNANDSTSNAYNGTIVGEVLSVADRFGNESSAYDFTNGQIQTGLKERPDGISIWFKTTVGGNLITWGENENYIHPIGYNLSISEAGVKLQYAYGDGQNAPEYGGTNIEVAGLLNGEWRHMVVSIDIVNGFMNLYIDGVDFGDIGIPSNNMYWEGFSPGSQGMLIGSNSGISTAGTIPFEGIIDDLHLFTGTVNQQDVDDFYYFGSWPFSSFENTLISEWSLNGNGNDLTSNNLDLTPQGPTPVNDRFNNANSAYNFVEDTLRRDNFPVFDNMSISAWFRTSADYSAGFVSFVDVVGTGGISIGATNQLETGINFGTLNTYEVLSSGSQVNDGKWHHAVMSFNGEEFNLYLDNTLVDSRLLSGNILHAFNPTFLNLGLNYRQDVSNYFNGDIDDVMYFNYGIDAAGVESLYTRQGWPLYFQVADWPLDGGTAEDISGNNLSGQVVGAVSTTDRFLSTGAALDFNGIDNYVSVAHNEVLNVGTSTDFAVSGWFNTSASSGVLFDKSDGNTGYLAFFPDDGSNRLLFFAVQSGVGSSQVLSAAGYNDGKWHHFVCQADRDGGMSIYIDGGLNGEATGALSDGFNPDTQEDFLIGAAGGVDNAGLNTFFSGKLDDFQVFNELLSDEQIRALFEDRGFPVIEEVKLNSAEFEPIALAPYQYYSQSAFGNAVGVISSEFQFNINVDYFYGDDDFDGKADILGTPISLDSGLNFVRILNETKEYIADPITSMGFIGSARTGDESGWEGPDTDMTDLGDGIFVLSEIQLFDGFWKVRANDSWDFSNWGGVEGSSEMMGLNGLDIPISAGIYEITVDVLNKTYSVVDLSVPEALVGEYLFSSNTDDTSGNENNGTATDISFAGDRFQNSSSAARFNGTSSFISIPDTTSLNFGNSTDIAVSGWFKTSSGGVIFDKSNGSTGFFGMVHSTGELYFFMVETSSSTTNQDITSVGTYNDDKWHHFIIQVDRDAGMQIYVDGVLDTENTIATDGINPDMTEDFLIGVAAGVDNATPNSYFSGLLDDIRIYNQVLTPEEILDQYLVGGWPIVFPPRISGISPLNGMPGSSVTIRGSNFGSTANENFVFFDGIRANVTGASEEQLVVEVPLGASYAPIQLTANGLTTTSNQLFNVVFSGNGLPMDSSSFELTRIEDAAPDPSFRQGSIAKADFDQDGLLDVALVGSNLGFSVLRNSSVFNGAITFDARVEFTIANSPRNIATGDLDSDGRSDLIVSNGNGFSIYMNTSTGAGDIAFQNVQNITFAGDLALDLGIADMNGDGKQDIVVIERVPPVGEFNFFSDFNLRTYSNVGENGNFVMGLVNVTAAPNSNTLLIRDLNGDGKKDVAFSTFNTPFAALLNIADFSQGDFGFSPLYSFEGGGAYVDITAGDYDRDGKMDIAVSDDPGGGSIDIFVNSTTNPQDTSLSFLDKKTFLNYVAPTSLKSNDFDGDGKIDLLVTDIGEDSYFILQNSTTQVGDVKFNAKAMLQKSASYDIVTGDFNADGKVDIFGAGSSNDLLVFENKLKSADEITRPSAQPSGLTFSDIGTGRLSVSFVAASSHNGNYLILRNATSSPQSVPTDGVNYDVGDVLGQQDRVAYVGPEVSFVDSLLNQDTRYFYSIYAFNGSGAISKFLKTNPLTGDEITLAVDQLATEPTDQPTEFAVTNFDEANKSFQVNYTAPATSIDGYLVVRTLNKAPLFIPMDGRSYDLGAVDVSDSIVYIGTATEFIEQNILSDNEYKYLVFGYNGSAETINYLQNDPLAGGFNVPSAQPSLQPINFVVNSNGPNAVNFSFTPAESVSGYVVLRNEVQSPSSAPEDFLTYQYGDQIDGDVVIYSGSSNSVIDNNLNPLTQYFYAIFAYNGSGDLINYLSDAPLTGSLTTTALPNLAVEPQAQATGFEVNEKTENSAELTFTKSDASGYLIVRTQSTSSFFSPADGVTYSLNSRFGNAFITYIGSENTWVEEDLMPFTNYNFKLFAFNGSGDEINYLQASPLQGQLLTLTTAPTTQASDLTVTEQTFAGFTFTFGGSFEDADGYIVVRAEGETPPATLPTDGISLNVGDVLSEGELVVSVGTSEEVQETDLTVGDTFSYSIYAYRGDDNYINYNTVDPLTTTVSTLVDNTAPILQNIQFPDEVNLGENVSVSVTIIEEESAVEEVFIEYIVPGANNFENPTVASMTASGNEYSFELPAVSEAGYEFRISANNILQLNESSAIQSVIVVFPNEGLTIPFNSFGTEESNYRIISVPLALDAVSINDVFGSQLGEYGDLSKWRMFRYSNETTSELTGNTSLIPGRGYWLIVNGEEVNFSTGAGKNVSASVDEPYEIVLSPGWNQIGNPYPYDVSWSDVQQFNNESFPLRIFNGSFSDGNTLSAFSGGFVNWANSSDFTLRIPKTIPTASQNRNIEESGHGWDINLILENGNTKNELTGFGMHENAKDELDSKDHFNLPHFMSYIDLKHPIVANGYHVAKNIVKMQDQYSWTFDFESNLELRKTTVAWQLPMEESFDPKNELFLWDPSASNLIDMKNTNYYQLRNSSGKGMKIIYGSMNYVNSMIEVSSFQVNDPFPNPTAGNINLNYFIPEGGEGSMIKMELIDSKGSLVNSKTILVKYTGFQNITWDVHAASGERLKGVYLLRLNNGISQINKKIIVH